MVAHSMLSENMPTMSHVTTANVTAITTIQCHGHTFACARAFRAAAKAATCQRSSPWIP